MSTQHATRAEALHFPTTPAEIWEAYEVDILAAKATLPRTWRDWLHLPTTEARRTVVGESAFDNRNGTPLRLQAWCVLGALAGGDWRDARSWAGTICERCVPLFHLYLHVSRALAPLGELGEFVRDCAWACSLDPDFRAIGRVLVATEAQLVALRSRRALRAFHREYARHMLLWRWQTFCAADRSVQAVALAALLWLVLAVCWALTARH
jgi:hypothetical protein